MIEAVLEPLSPVLIQAAYQLTESDFYEAQAQHKGWSGRVLQVIGIAVALCAVPSLFTHHYTQALIGLSIGFVLTFGLTLSARLAFKREPSLRVEMTVVASEDGLRFVSLNGESKLNWSAFVRFVETEHIFVLYVQSRMFHVIPKRAFSPEDLVALVGIFKRHIANSPRQQAGSLDTKVFLSALVIVSAIVLIFLAVHSTNH